MRLSHYSVIHETKAALARIECPEHSSDEGAHRIASFAIRDDALAEKFPRPSLHAIRIIGEKGQLGWMV